MKARHFFLLPAFLLVFNMSSFSQEMNLAKASLTSLLSGNISLQYERILTEKVSTSLSLSMMPKKGLPFAGLISNSMEVTNEDIDFDIKNIKFSSWSMVPDIRFYLGEGYGQGFYIGPYFKHSQFKVHDFDVQYTNIEQEVKDITLSGKFRTNSAGVMFGAQWLLGEYICLDWWILGFHGGRSKATFTGEPSWELSEAEQDDLKQELETLELSMLNFESTVSADKVSIISKSPWLGVRAGLSIGVRF